MLHRLLPIFLLIAAIIFVVFNFQDLKRNIVYRLGISGDPTTSCCSEQQVLNSTGEFDENANVAIFDGQVIDYPKTSLAHQYSQSLAQENINENAMPARPAGGPAGRQVLGTMNASGEEKWIEIALDEQKLRAWEGNKLVMEFPISSGKWAPTPKGTFNIWYKTKSQSMIGGSQALGTYYNLPNVPNNMFFYKGYAIHGAYWHNNFGHPMSHGCVNEPLANAVQIFDWAGPVLADGQNALRATPENPGTRVLVH